MLTDSNNNRVVELACSHKGKMREVKAAYFFLNGKYEPCFQILKVLASEDNKAIVTENNELIIL